MSKWVKILAALGLLCGIAVIALVYHMNNMRQQFTKPVLLRPDVAMIEMGYVNAYAVRTEHGVILFDTGPDAKGVAMDALLAALQSKRSEVFDIFLTHAHGDHISGAPLFTNARVWGGVDDVDLAAGRALPNSWLAKVFNVLLPPPKVQIAHVFTTDERAVVQGNSEIKAIAMPGHTRGSYAYLYKDLLFVGDAMNVQDGKLVSFTKAFTDNPERATRSIAVLQTQLAQTPLDRICAGHGGCTVAGHGNVDLKATIKNQ